MKDLPLSLTSRTIKPARLVVMTLRDETVLRIAEAQSSIVIGSGPFAGTYTPVAGCQISAIKSVTGGEVPSMQIVAAHSYGGFFDTDAIDKGLFDSADVQVLIVNRASPTTTGLMFTGTVQPISYTVSGGVSFDIRGQSVQAVGSFIQTASPMCRTDLFSPLCGVDPDDYEHTAVVDTVLNRHNFTIASLSTPRSDGYFNGGTVLTDEGVAFEVASWIETGSLMTAYLPCDRFIIAGQGLTIWPGCDKLIGSGCAVKFNNAANFQGEPHSLGVYAASVGG